jgi:hypothetical protein
MSLEQMLKCLSGLMSDVGDASLHICLLDKGLMAHCLLGLISHGSNASSLNASQYNAKMPTSLMPNATNGSIDKSLCNKCTPALMYVGLNLYLDKCRLGQMSTRAKVAALNFMTSFLLNLPFRCKRA